MSKIDTLSKPFATYVIPAGLAAYLAKADAEERNAFDEKVSTILANFSVTSELAHRHASRVFFKRTPYGAVPQWTKQVIEEEAARLAMLVETHGKDLE